ncbi:Gfo/Idh/MocA family protein [Microbacterium elymi]|uniref:Gfo/Idh/MocA family oxidoreductase n=1 Tax=Microbacterium elymi TaxID=2909587 RepID=A0ABY5NGH2_9MICO|nr:Gfo/Idh/MocA family oxidoreductase [Microbacterium elymi]UUT34279.1 Gfo/Idh/MocA family oxidoreductase [Microbacterium elymi]
MPFTIGIVGAGQFADTFAPLLTHHPLIGEVWVTDVVSERADRLVARYGLSGTFDSFDQMLADPRVDAVAIFTQRWTHGALAVQALRAGKHVYSTVPMGISVDEIGAIIDAVTASGLVYMMGETSFYNPATVLARDRNEAGAFGRLFYAEGDYLHDMDLGFYDAYRFSGGEDWRRTASYPPLLYPTHSIGGILGAWDTHVTKAIGIGVRDTRGDGVFDRSVSMFDNDISNATALFEVAGGGSFRTNEFRRVGYPSHIRESRFRYFGTEASFEEVATAAFWYTREGAEDVSRLVETSATLDVDDPSLAHIAPDLRPSFVSGYAPVHHRERIPAAVAALPNGHEGSHHFLVDDFAVAVDAGGMPPVNAWRAARFTVPGIIAHESVRRDGERLDVPDFGDIPGS